MVFQRFQAVKVTGFQHFWPLLLLWHLLIEKNRRRQSPVLHHWRCLRTKQPLSQSHLDLSQSPQLLLGLITLEGILISKSIWNELESMKDNSHSPTYN
nr:hypothetical protein CFP56_33263 [Quercus suber]